MTKRLFAIVLSLVVLAANAVFPASAHHINDQQEASSLITEEYWNSADVRIEENILVLSKTAISDTSMSRTADFSADGSQSTSTEHCSQEITVVVPKEGFTAEEVYEHLASKYDSGIARSSGNKTENQYDSSVSIEATLTIYYDRTTYREQSYVMLTQVVGGYRKLDRQVRVNYQYLTVGATGFPLNGGTPVTQNQEQNYESATAWTYTPPSTWEYILEESTGMLPYFGAWLEFEIQRTGSDHTWTLIVENML